MGCLTPVRGIKDPTAELMRRGREYLPEEAERLYEKGLPNIQTIQTEAPITAFMNRRRIVSAFDSLELEKRDTVVMAKSVYKVLNMYRKNRAKYLMVPNATLGGDSDCSVLLTFDDIARCDQRPKARSHPEMHDAIGPWPLHRYRRGDAGAVHEEDGCEGHGAAQDRYEVCE